MKTFDGKMDISKERESFQKYNQKFLFSIRKRMDIEKSKQEILKQMMQKIKHSEDNVKLIQDEMVTMMNDNNIYYIESEV